ncbi:MAG TPA: tetratricopeptide repeat protein, partial [Pirellulaceae bacterium]|nr:tetratricopeptide repeat protein [Pirellulaceae bacterium]
MMKAEEIFLAALERTSPTERAAYLDGACAGNAAQRALVEGLLYSHHEAGSFLDAPLFDAAATIDQPLAERTGAQIGPYKLLQQIGEGGFGVVFMAEQLEPVRRKVALKLIKPGMDTRQVIARFEAERQALAVMDHPHIAKVLDAGATESGRPYFVMELVRGVPITHYCDENHLSVRERLGLFASVCQAIQHAHTKGIIHRDIKPTNVLVTRQDAQAVVKVIDFGIAKAMGQQLTDKTLFTDFAQMIGTPLYMSPEQAELSSVDIDTRSDIYSLGVLLYELLTGSTPVSKEQLKQAAFDEIRRIIREVEPPKPSTRISSAEAAPSIAAQRHTEPAKLARLVRGELDWIVMKALEKDRGRRYETANGFAMDVQRYLDDEPVLACPPSAGYRLRKFARKNKTALATVAAVALLVLVAAGSVGWTLNERRERFRRNADEIVRAVDEGRKLLGQRRWPEALALARHGKNVLDYTAGQNALRPSVEALVKDLEMIQRLEEIELRAADMSVGNGIGYARPANEYHPAFQNYGIDVLALEIDAAAEVRKRQIADYLIESLDAWARDEQDPATRARLRTVVQKADPEGILARRRAALDRGDTAELQRIITDLGALGRVPPATLAILGETLFRSGLRKEAIEFLRAAHVQHPEAFWINQNLASAHARTEPPQWDEALRHYTAALALRPRSHMLYTNIGVALNALGQRADALAAWRKALELEPTYAPALSNIGWLFVKDEQYDEAEAALQKAIAKQPDFAIAHRNLAVLYGKTKRTTEAMASFDEALKFNHSPADVYSARGTIWMIATEFDKAIADFHRAIEHDDKFAEAYHGLGAVAEKQKHYADAVQWYETALRHDLQLVATHYRLGVTYSAWGQQLKFGSPQLATEKFDKAIAWLNDTIRLDEQYAEAWYSLGNASRERGQIQAAITAFERAAALKPASDDAAYQPHYNLGNIYLRLGDYPQAIKAYRAAISATGYALAYTNLGVALGEQGDLAEAEKYAMEALARVKSPDNIRNVAIALDRQGRYAEALAILQRSLERFEGGEEQRALIE